MSTKIIQCIDCGCDVEIKQSDYRTKRCVEHNTEHKKKYQQKYQSGYHSSYRGVLTKGNQKQRTYKKRNVGSSEEMEYCKNNWNTVQGCLNCIAPECIQEEENDTMLPWENDGFYKDDVKINQDHESKYIVNTSNKIYTFGYTKSSLWKKFNNVPDYNNIHEILYYR